MRERDRDRRETERGESQKEPAEAREGCWLPISLTQVPLNA